MPTDVHPQIKEILDATLVARVPKLHTLTHIEARELMEKLAHARRGDCSPPKVNETEDTTTDSSHGAVPMRIYRNHISKDFIFNDHDHEKYSSAEMLKKLIQLI